MSSQHPVKIIHKALNTSDGTDVTVIVENNSAEEAAKEVKAALQELSKK